MDIDKYIEAKLNEPNNYSKGYVAFLDLLGFKEMCRNESCEYIKAVLDDIDLQIIKFADFSSLVIPEKIKSEITVKVISDSIIITTPDDIYGLLYILYYCSILHTMLLSCNILVRGGIAFGEFFSTSNTIFGSALVKAHDIENYISIYPRVVLSNEIVTKLNEMKVFEKISAKDLVKKYAENNVPIYDESRQIRMLTQFSEDGFLFVNYFNILEFIKLNQTPYKFEKFNSLIKQNLEKYQNNPKLLPKYQWLNEYFKKNILEADLLYPKNFLNAIQKEKKSN